MDTSIMTLIDNVLLHYTLLIDNVKRVGKLFLNNKRDFYLIIYCVLSL